MVDKELKCQEQVAGEGPFLLQEMWSGREGLFCFRAGERGPGSCQQTSLSGPEPTGGEQPRGRAESSVSSWERVLGVSGQVSPWGRRRVGSPERAGNPTCFSAAPPGSLHSTLSPGNRESLSFVLCRLWPSPPPTPSLQLTR